MNLVVEACTPPTLSSRALIWLLSQPSLSLTPERIAGKAQQSGRQAHQGQGHKRGAGLRTAEVGASGKGFVKLIKENFGFIR